MKKIVILFAAVLSLMTAFHCQAKELEEGRSSPGSLKYAWAGKPIAGDLWDMAQADVDSDGAADTVLLERRRIRVGSLSEVGFAEKFSCGWKAAADAARVYLIDLDADGKPEAAISAVEDGLPASLVLRLDPAAGRCEEAVSYARYSVRALDVPDESGSLRRKLVGQAWNQEKFFSGAVRELALFGNKLKAGERLDLPRYTDIYQFAMLASADGAPSVAVLKGPAHMEIYENVRQGKWKRVWRSGERLGGTSNALPAEQRPALDEVMSDLAIFDMSPIAIGSKIFAVKADMPAHDIVGTKPYVRGGEVVEFVPDSALGYVEQVRTQWLPGEIAAMAMDQARGLVLLLKNNAGAFENASGAKIISFDIP